MKSVSKILAVLLAVLMLSTCAFAVEIAAESEAPEIVNVTDESGHVLFALIHDKDGNLVARLEADDMVITDFKDMEDAEDHTKEDMENAYEQIKNAESLINLCDQAADMLAEIDPTLHIDNMQISSFVNVHLDDEYRAYLEDDHTITLTFKLKVKESDKLLVLEHTEDDEWITADPEDVVFNEDGTVSITMGNVQHVAFALPGKSVDFVPSVTQKDAPLILLDGEEIGRIEDENGEILLILNEDDIHTLSIANLAEYGEAGLDEEIASLKNAYNQIRAAKSVADFAPDAVQALKEIAPDLTPDDLVVRDLFEPTLGAEAREYLQGDDHALILTFDMKLKTDDVLLALANYEDDQWKILPATINDDGTVSVRIDTLCPIAFVVESSALSVDMEKTSPQTGMGATAGLMTAGIGAVGVAAVGILRRKIRK